MDQTSDLWIDLDIESESIPQPAPTREQLLPLQSLSWENFERLCYRLALRGSDVADCRRYGIQGQGQQGIDLYIRRASDGRYATWQCKRHKGFTTSELEDAVDRFLVGEWAARSQLFHLVVSISLVPTDFAEAVEAQAQKCRAYHIEFVPFDAERLSEMLKPHADIVDDFFGRFWVEAFCGLDAAKPLSGRRISKAERLKARRKLRELYETHFSTIDVGLPAAAPRFRRAAPALSLHDRYITPVVEALTSVLEVADESRSAAAAESAGSTQETSASNKATARHLRAAALRVSEQRTQSDFFAWFASARRGVLLGGPGLGKSAALRFATLDVLSDQPRSAELARRWGAYLPLFLPFAFLTRMVAENEVVSIPDCCRAWFHKLSARPEEVALLEGAFEDERLLLLLDGLDEWSDATSAQTVLAKVQAFIDSRHLPTIVSARPLGYERLGGLGREWKHGELMPFGEEQQRQFAFLWFEHFLTDSSSEVGTAHRARAAKTETDSLMTELEAEAALAELAGIPLLLSALIYLRLEGRVLPQNRFEVLEAIATTLIAEQPLRRAKGSLQGSGPSRNARLIVERGIEVLALAVHQQPGSDAINEDNARNLLADFYQAEEFKKPAGEAHEIATGLIEQAAQAIGILVERHPGHIGFLHRSLQEHLAAKRLMRLPFTALRAFVVEKLGESNWQEVLLQILHLSDRADEVDELLTLIRNTQLQPLTEPIRQILLARAVCGNVTCSASLANEIADNLFSIIEASAWMPLRMSLVSAIVTGLDSEHIGTRIRQPLERWFPGRSSWRWGIFAPLASKPVPGTARRLTIALFNAHSDLERRRVAEAIAAGAGNWPGLADELHSTATQAAEPELIVAALHALALGWPDDPRVSELLNQASVCLNDKVRCVACIHRARRGDTSATIKYNLSAFCDYDARPYPWEDEVIRLLAQQWPRDGELRALALRAAPRPIMGPKWNPRMALRYLLKAYPDDNNVAEIIGDVLRREEHIRVVLDFDEISEDLQIGFAGRPVVACAAEEWLEKYGRTLHSGRDIALVAMLGRSAKCKAFLIERLTEGQHFPIWPIRALIQIAGADDAEVSSAVAPYLADPKQVWLLGSILPDLIPDRDICRKRLLDVFEDVTGSGIGQVLRGLMRLNSLADPDTLNVLDRRLGADADRNFWWHAKDALIQNLFQHPAIRRAAALELDDDDASVFGEPLHEELRLEIVRSLRKFALRLDDPFPRSVLGHYRREWHGQTRAAAADAYYSAVRKLSGELQSLLDDLSRELLTTGGLTERCQSAVVGLLALGRPDIICEARTAGGRQRLKISLQADATVNWELVVVLVREWENVLRTCGDQAWKIFGGWDVIVSELARSGRRSLALLAPKDLEEGVRTRVEQDLDGFRALTVLQRNTDTLRELCLQLFSRFRRDPNRPSISWGYQELEVMGKQRTISPTTMLARRSWVGSWRRLLKRQSRRQARLSPSAAVGHSRSSFRTAGTLAGLEPSTHNRRQLGS